jgi:hypothetical protein
MMAKSVSEKGFIKS